MKKIEDIKIKKKKVVITILRHEYYLSKDSFTDGYYYIGKELTSLEFKEIEEASKKKNVNLYLTTLLSKRRYTNYEVENKLKDKFKLNDFEIKKTLSKYIESKIIDDYSYTYDFVLFKIEKNYGKKKIIDELKRKGISEDIYNDLSIQSLFTKEQDINSLLKKVDKKNLPHLRRKEHLLQYLIRRGFNYNESEKHIEKYLSSFSDNENKNIEEQKRVFLKKEIQKCYNHLASKEYSEKEKTNYLVSHLMRKGYSKDEILYELKESITDD